MSAKTDGSEVILTWQGDADEWAIIHNGEEIDTTSSNKYRHSPTMVGNHSYNILPIIDGQTIHWDGSTSSDSVELDSNIVPDAPGPSDTAGLIFSIVILLAGLSAVVFSFIPRRD